VSKPNHRRHPRRWLFRFGRGKLAAEVEMPLKDHGHSPLKDFCPFSSLHSLWIGKVVEQLNLWRLSDEYVAHAETHAGSQIEIDVGTYERFDSVRGGGAHNGVPGSPAGNGGVAVATGRAVYVAPVPELTAPVSFTDPDLFEIKVYRGGGLNLVAAIEFVSEANKDRPDSRRAFAVKVASYLQKGISVITIDIISNRSANLHDDLCDVIRQSDGLSWHSPSGLAATCYRTIRSKTEVRLDAWPFPLEIGKALPTIPLWLNGELAVPIDLEETYVEACKSLKIR
jgi:hypothetical protein